MEWGVKFSWNVAEEREKEWGVKFSWTRPPPVFCTERKPTVKYIGNYCGPFALTATTLVFYTCRTTVASEKAIWTHITSTTAKQMLEDLWA